MKTYLFIIPGMGEFITDKPYKAISQYAAKDGYEPVAININWDIENVPSDFIKEASQRVEETMVAAGPDGNFSIMGFSVGALIASILANRFNFKQVFLCSMSPYFGEDIVFLPDDTKEYLGKSFTEDAKLYSFPVEISSEVVFMFGDKDWSMAIEKAQKRCENLKSNGKRFILVSDTGHELTNKYIQTIQRELKMHP